MNIPKAQGHFPSEPSNQHGYRHTPVDLPEVTDADKSTAFELSGRYVSAVSQLTWAAQCVALGRLIGARNAKTEGTK